MRPRYLEIEGLQSFKEVQKVDFDKLGETGLFGIFGPTGSGKSTVLDAITLALYGNVQRALRGTHGIMNIYSDNLRVVYTFDLQKDKLRKTYKVERVYKRKKGSENFIEVKLARLSDITGEGNVIIADKPSEVTSKVEELLGLNLDDFTRSVVLPQNKFQEFLFLEKSKRREMLERIFYLEEYGRNLSEKVNRKLNATKNKLSNIEGALSALGDISEKSLIEAEKKVQEARDLKEKVDKELKNLELNLNQAREVWDLVKELNFILEKEETYISKQPEIDLMKKQYEESMKAEGLKELIEQYRSTGKKLYDTVSQLDTLLQEINNTENVLKDIRKHYEICKKSFDEEIPRLVELKTKLESALELRKEADDLEKKLKVLREEYVSLKLKIESKEKEIHKKKTDLSECENKIQEYSKTIENLKVDIDYRSQVQAALRIQDETEALRKEKDRHEILVKELTKKTEILEEKLAVIELEKNKELSLLEGLKNEQIAQKNSKPDDRDNILKDINTYHNIKAICQSLKYKRKDIDDLKVVSEEVHRNIEQYIIKYNEAEKYRDSLYEELEKLKTDAEQARKEYEKNSAYILALNLKKGEPCPVCGSVNHPAPASAHNNMQEMDVLEEKLKDIRENLGSLEIKARESDSECIKLKEQLEGLRNKLKQTREEISKKENEYEALASNLPENIRSINPEQMDYELEKINNNNLSRLKAVDEWENNINALEKKIADLNNTVSRYLADENGIKAELRVNRENLAQEKNRLKASSEQYTGKLSEMNAIKNRLGIADIITEIRRIEENDRKVEALRKNIENQQNRSKEIRENIEKLTWEKQEMLTRYSALEADGKTISSQKKEKEERITLLAGQGDIYAQLANVEEKIIRIQQEEKKYFELISKTEAKYNELNTQRAALENQKSLYEKYLNVEKQQLYNALEEKGFTSIEQAEKSIIPQNERDKMAEIIKDYEQARINLKANRELLQKKLNGRSISESEWDDINGRYNEKRKERDDSIALYESARNTYASVKKNFDIWVGLIKEYKEYSRKCDMLEHIQKLLRGNSFVEFVAEERLRYIAKEASQTLGILTKYRYALELDSESGFVIRDNMQGGIHRLVTSLSGGETFLTSLSLALALSKQIQLKGQSPLEFFFLDEGFGTLDGNLLDTVIDSLERISSSDRVIGLISHIPEVKNRVARRLIVEPPTSEGVGTRVYIEKA
ncbi:MAG TPA: AAA family ATPase [Clostridiaceae bacterium]|nr:AAA family ATPase [Clostridiaceae bacterium]